MPVHCPTPPPPLHVLVGGLPRTTGMRGKNAVTSFLRRQEEEKEEEEERGKVRENAPQGEKYEA